MFKEWQKQEEAINGNPFTDSVLEDVRGLKAAVQGVLKDLPRGDRLELIRLNDQIFGDFWGRYPGLHHISWLQDQIFYNIEGCVVG